LRFGFGDLDLCEIDAGDLEQKGICENERGYIGKSSSSDLNITI
jgi:hypothetical protein